MPIARWRGFGGTTDFNGICFETSTWAAGLAAATERIMVFSPSHVPTVHPIVIQGTQCHHRASVRGDSLAEGSEFELPVPVCKLSDDSILLEFSTARRIALIAVCELGCAHRN